MHIAIILVIRAPRLAAGSFASCLLHFRVKATITQYSQTIDPPPTTPCQTFLGSFLHAGHGRLFRFAVVADSASAVDPAPYLQTRQHVVGDVVE